MDHPAQSAIEARGAFGELIAALEEGARGAGRGNGNGGGNDGRGNGGGNDGGDGGAGGGDDLGPVDGRMLVSSLRQMAELQTRCSLTLADAMIKALERERGAREEQLLAVAKQLGETITTALRLNANLAEYVANFGERIVALESRLRPTNAAAADQEEPSR
jgi:hypothetical protein